MNGNEWLGLERNGLEWKRMARIGKENLIFDFFDIARPRNHQFHFWDMIHSCGTLPLQGPDFDHNNFYVVHSCKYDILNSVVFEHFVDARG